MSWWIYKCNSRQHANQVASGDWNDFFSGRHGKTWGRTESVPQLLRLQAGDHVIAYQTDRNELVGVARVLRFQRDRKHKRLQLKAVEIIGTKVKPLKTADARVAAIPALQPGPIQTIYDISDADANALLRSARRAADRAASPNGSPRHWRMAMRYGPSPAGESLWPQCRDQGVAAIAYRPFKDLNLRNYPHDGRRWRKLSGSAGFSLRYFVHFMRPGDIVYVKDGPHKIVAKGRVLGPYEYRARSTIGPADGSGMRFQHQRRVEWQVLRPAVTVPIEPSPPTVLLLSDEDVTRIEQAIERQTRDRAHDIRTREFHEGTRARREAVFFQRNPQLATQAKESYGYICQICGFDFVAQYGEIGKEFIECHHLDPLSERPEEEWSPKLTRLERVTVLCSNCHRMVHRTKPATPCEELRVNYPWSTVLNTAMARRERSNGRRALLHRSGR